MIEDKGYRHALEDIIVISEVDNGPVFAGHIFQRKYRLDVPDFEHHVVAFYRKSADLLVPASYAHFWLRDDICLVGGACTDGRAFAHMSDAHRGRVSAEHGLLFHTMRFGFHKYAGRCDAFFGLCGDTRAWDVVMQAGFKPAGHRHLIVNWHKPLSEERQTALIEQALAAGPF